MNDLIITCGRCRREIRTGDGFLGVSLREIREYHAAEAEWKQAHPGDEHSLEELLSMADEVEWRTRHYACAPGADSDAYEIGTDTLRSLTDLTRWSSHLMAKNWIQLTDWDELTREVSDGSGTRIVVRGQEQAA